MLFRSELFPSHDSQDSNTSRVTDSLNTLPSDAGYYIIFANQGEKEKNGNNSFPSYSVIKLWIAAAAFKKYGLDNSEINPIVTSMLVSSDNNATNKLIDKMSFETVNSFLRENNYSNTYLGRHMLETGTTYDNTTSPREAAVFMSCQ